VPHSSYTTGWIALAVVSSAFALVGFAGHNPSARSASRRVSSEETEGRSRHEAMHGVTESSPPNALR